MEFVLWLPGSPWFRSFWIEAAERSNAIREAETFQDLIRSH